jgi:hypothetical protein
MALGIVWFFLVAGVTDHKQFHGGKANSSEQTCVFCLFNHGHVEAALTPMPLPTPVLNICADLGLRDPSLFVPEMEYRLQPGRAPPAACF